MADLDITRLTGPGTPTAFIIEGELYERCYLSAYLEPAAGIRVAAYGKDQKAACENMAALLAAAGRQRNPSADGKQKES